MCDVSWQSPIYIWISRMKPFLINYFRLHVQSKHTVRIGVCSANTPYLLLSLKNVVCPHDFSQHLCVNNDRIWISSPDLSLARPPASTSRVLLSMHAHGTVPAGSGPAPRHAGALGSRPRALGSRPRAPGSRPWAPGSRFPSPGSRLRPRAPGSNFPSPGSRLRPRAPGSCPCAVFTPVIRQ